MSTSSSVSEARQAPDEELDRRIVLATQAGLPIHARPYEVIAQELDCDVDLLKARLQKMLEDGRIRRIGVVPNHYRLGVTANGMSVWEVDAAKLDEAGKLVGALDDVSHCYRRPKALPDWPYNLFAMVHGKYRDEVMQKVEEIAHLLGDRARSYEVLFSTRILKKTGLRLR